MFGTFDAPDGYSGFFPSPHYLSTAWAEFMQKRSVARVDKVVKGVEAEGRLAKTIPIHCPIGVYMSA